ncbi:MAG: GAF domain-containing protein [Elainellaceae cyanobacterium]
MGSYEKPQALSSGLSQGLAEFGQQSASLEMFQGALYNVPMPTFLHADDGEILFVNRAWTDISGYALEDIPTMSIWLEKACGQHKELLIPAIDRLYELDARLDEGEDYITTKNGAVRTWYFSSAPAGKLSDGRRLVVTTAVDMTESDRAKELLWEYTLSQSVLGKITQQIQSTLELSEVLNIAATEVRQLFRADRVIILQDQPDDAVVTVHAESADSNLLPMLNDCFEDPWCSNEQYAQGKAHTTFKTGDAHPSGASAFLSQHKIQVAIAAPIVQESHRWGTLCICQHFSIPSWKPFLIEFVEQLTAQIAIAIQQSELHQRIQQLNVSLEQQVQERTAQLQQALNFEALLRRIGDRVRDSLDEQQILKTAADEMLEHLDLDECCITTYRSDAKAQAVYYNVSGTDVENLCPAAYKTYFHNFRFNQSPSRSLQFCPTALALPELRHTTSVLACSLINQKMTLGHFWLLRPNATPFSPSEISLVEQIGNYCAMAIYQARQYGASQQQVIKLTELSRLKDDFLSTVSHELRTPLTNIEMAIQMLAITLKNHEALSESPQIQRYFGILRSECTREIDLVNDLLDLQRLEAGGKALKPITLDLHCWLPQLLNSFQERAQMSNQTLRFDLPETPCKIVCDEATFRRIVVELLNNACKYTPAGENITVAVQLEPETVQLQVANFGVEIPELELAHIFERFYRGHHRDRWKQRGTGLGLALIKDLVALLSGDIHVVSQANETVFTVRLPLFLPGAANE